MAGRLRSGLTQEELANRAGLSTRTVRNLERGSVVRPRSHTVRMLAGALGADDGEAARMIAAASALAGSSEHDVDAVGGLAALGAPGWPLPANVVPAQLPLDVRGFTGRATELQRLDELCGPQAPDAGFVVISTVSGMAGVGKTALALRWAHRVVDRFPDGQLYVNLRGYDPERPVSAADALAGFMLALGVGGSDIPLEVEDRAARYRSEIAGRRMLIVLDNASSVEQVRPLLPGTPTCAVVVTSRDSLAGLVAMHGACRLDLDLLPPDDAVALLRRLVGPRVDAEHDAATTLSALCGRLPLALRVAAELAVSRPAVPLPELVAELADRARRLELLDAGGDPRAAIATVFSWSVRQLPAAAADMFALLGLHPGADIDGYAAAALADISLRQARRRLDLLARTHLVQPAGADRWVMHDLLRAYAAELASAQDAAHDPRKALTQLFDYYLATAAAAMNILHPAERHRRPDISPPATPSPDLTDPESARAWLDAERACLVAVAGYTAARGWPGHSIDLSPTLYRYLDGGHHTDALALHGHARDAARRTGDQTGQAHALLGLGLAHLRLGRHAQAIAHKEEALALFRQAGDRLGEARALSDLGTVEERLGHYQVAAEYHKQALVLYRQEGDRLGQGHILGNLGIIEERLGHYRTASEYHEQALVLCRQIGARYGEARGLNNLGFAEQGAGRYESAAMHHQQAVALYRQLGNRSGEAGALDNLGTVHLRLGRPEQATKFFQQALTLLHSSGERYGEPWLLNGLGEAARAVGRTADALTHHTAALAAAAETGARDQQARAHTGLGHAYAALHDLASAREHRQQALALYNDLGSPDADDVRVQLAALG